GVPIDVQVGRAVAQSRNGHANEAASGRARQLAVGIEGHSAAGARNVIWRARGPGRNVGAGNAYLIAPGIGIRLLERYCEDMRLTQAVVNGYGRGEVRRRIRRSSGVQ